MFLGLRKLGNICCRHKMFLNKDTKFVSATNVARADKRGNICVGNNVSSFATAFTIIAKSNYDSVSFNLLIAFVIAMAICSIIVHCFTSRGLMHDAACEFACAVRMRKNS